MLARLVDRWAGRSGKAEVVRLSTLSELWLWHKFRDRVLLITLCPLWMGLRYCYLTWRRCAWIGYG
jgi:hypothetical protein